MSVYTYAIYRCARQLMTPDELDRALALAADAEKGNASAASMLWRLVLSIICDCQENRKAA